MSRQADLIEVSHLTLAQAARLLGIKRPSLHEAVERGAISSVVVLGTRMVPTVQVQAYADRRRSRRRVERS